MYLIATDLMLWYGPKELGECAGPTDMEPVSGGLMRLTIESGDRSSYSAEEITAADTALAQIEATIAQAEQMADSYLAGRYTLPLDTATVDASPLPRVCGALVRSYLHGDGESEVIATRRETAMRWLRDLAVGKVNVGGASVPASTGIGSPGFRPGKAVFGDMEGYE